MSKYEEQGPHIIEVERVLRGENDERMIGIAESAYPPREEVLKAIESAHFKLGEVPAEEKLWWYSEFDDVRIPYAITGDAVRYYVELVEGFRQKDWKSDIEPSSEFKYSACVEFKRNHEKEGKRFRNVYVVEMKLAMEAQFASLAGVGFGKERTVVLDRKGRVLAVFGDGTTPTVVS